MSRNAHHLTRRGDVNYFRARVPTDLISAYGRAMVSVSLGTGDKTLAHVRLQGKVEEFQRELAYLRRQSRKLADDYTGNCQRPSWRRSGSPDHPQPRAQTR